MPTARTRSKLLRSALAVALLSASSACVERRLIVRTDPPGAAVYVDGSLVGRSDPEEGSLEVPFVHYGTRRVVVRAAGRYPERRDVELAPPWYQYFPLGFFSELLWPGTLVDRHEPAPFVLAPRGEPAAPEELERAAESYLGGGEGG